MADLLDARPLNPIPRFALHPKRRARSIYWHEVDSRPCLCETFHGHCFALPCPCGRHEGEVGT